MMLKVFFVFLGLTTTMFAKNDLYLLYYSSKDKNCTLHKNGLTLPTFDPRFEDKKKPSYSGYTCVAIQKELYNDCRVLSKKNVSAMFFAYGPYEYTNLIMVFKAPTKRVDGELSVECTKKKFEE